MDQCTYTFSPVGSPQNTTDASDALWVDCRFNIVFADGPQSYLPTRLLGPQPGVGIPQTLRKRWPSWDAAPEWEVAGVSYNLDPFVCRRAIGVHTTENPRRFGVKFDGYALPLTRILDCADSTPLSYCDYDIPTTGRAYWRELSCIGTTTYEAFSFYGPAEVEITFAMLAVTVAHVCDVGQLVEEAPHRGAAGHPTSAAADDGDAEHDEGAAQPLKKLRDER